LEDSSKEVKEGGPRKSAEQKGGRFSPITMGKTNGPLRVAFVAGAAGRGETGITGGPTKLEAKALGYVPGIGSID